MKSTGIVRKVDELGRIVLPMELRRTLEIADKDQVEIYLDDQSIILQKYNPGCMFCGKPAEEYEGRPICSSCRQNIGGSVKLVDSK